VIANSSAAPEAITTEATAVVENNTTVYDTGIYDAGEYAGYGEGTVIAVLDTGLDYTHPAFQSFTKTDVELAWDREYVKSVFDNGAFQLSAETRYSGTLSAKDVYVSDKVPFAFDYADDDPDVYPSYSNHGTHVAGIIGGYDTDGYTDKDGNPIAETFMGVVPDCQLVICKVFTDDFDDPELGAWYYAPRIMPGRFADLAARPGWVRLRGQESQTSLNRVSLLARKLTSVHATVTARMDFTADTFQQDAGLILYYDNMDYLYLRKYFDESLGCNALMVQRMDNGVRTEHDVTAVGDGALFLRLVVDGRDCRMEWGYSLDDLHRIGPVFDTSEFSDEYCSYGEFTGTMVGITCADRVFRAKCADFDFLEYEDEA
jgi:hypothetical protein